MLFASLHFKPIDLFNEQSAEVQAIIVLVALQQLCTFIVGLIPPTHTGRWWARALGRIANAKFRDARGTWKLPGQSADDPPAPAVAVVTPPGESGR